MLVALCSRKSNLNNSFLQADVLISSFSAHNPAVITLSHVLVHTAKIQSRAYLDVRISLKLWAEHLNASLFH